MSLFQRADFSVLPLRKRGRSGEYHTKDGTWGLYGAAGGFIHAKDPRTDEDKYLLLLPKVGRQVKGYWTLPGGAADEKETPKQAFSRELQEELGIPDAVIEKFTSTGAAMYESASGWRYTSLAVKAERMFWFALDPEESLDAWWFTEDEIWALVAEGKVYPKLADRLAELFWLHSLPKKS